MTDWLSSTWEANWRSFSYFNFYRLLLAASFFLMLLFPSQWVARFGLLPSSGMFALVAAYLVLVTLGGILSRRWQQHFNAQLSGQVVLDVLVISTLMYVAGGVSSGLGLILLISLAAASLVGRGRLVLFYAALATMAALLTQLLGVVRGVFDPASVVQAGFISAAYFATAVLARLLGQRVMINEELARRRGVALENQIRISQAVVERMQDGVLIISPAGDIVRCNPMAVHLLDLPEMPGQLSLRAPRLAQALTQWHDGQPMDNVLLSAPGGRELSARFEPTNSSDGEVLVFVEDIERIKARARQLKLASLGRLTASIAHEIRNPLAAISHAGELLQEELLDPVQRRLLCIVNDNAGRLNRIVGDVLELGRQKAAQPECVELAPLCTQVLSDLLAGSVCALGTVVMSIPAAARIYFDRAHLHQILSNLLANAVRHGSCTPGSVRIRTELAERPDWLNLHVVDDGPGIPQAVCEQIFEPFFTTHHQGTGLGLFIARELSALNGAQLELAQDAVGGHFILTGRKYVCQQAETNEAAVAD